MLNILRKFQQPNQEDILPPEAKEWARQCELTPDNWKLEQYMRQLIFVSCDMKAGLRNHDLIEPFINGPQPEEFNWVYTQNEYTFWKKDLGKDSFPVVLPKGFRPDAHTPWPVEDAPIQGELYFIPGSHIKELDKHKKNGIQSCRDRVKIRVPYRTVRYDPPSIDKETLLPQTKRRPLPVISTHFFYTVDAWMYMGIQSYWEPQIGGIFKSQMELYEHDTPRIWIKKYYKFTG